MILVTQLLATGEIVAWMADAELHEYIARPECDRLAVKVDDAQLLPPGAHEIHRDARSKTVILI
jgi:hypothetical protein